MFNLTPEGQALSVRHNLLIFKSSKPFQLGQSSKVKIQLPPQTGKPLVLPIQVLEELQHEKGGYVYQALVLVDLQGFEFIPPNSLAGHPVRIRVRSPELPNFQALAIEFTPQSTLLELSAKVPPGKACTLAFDLEGYPGGNFSCSAKSLFCIPSGSKCFGQFRFDLSDVAKAREIGEVFQFLGQRANSSLESLLESAKIVPTGALLPASHTQKPAQPVAELPKPEQLSIPIEATLVAYYRNVQSQSLILRFSEQGSPQELEFPHCQYVSDQETARCHQVATLNPLRSSPLLEQMQARLGPGDWRHYQFLSEDQVVLLELVSRPCNPFQG